MTRKRKWQSGAADLVAVAAGMVILSIAAAGTSAAIIYSREILGRQERYKTACYMLKREMEKKQWELESFKDARPLMAQHHIWLGREMLVTPDELQNRNQSVEIDLWIDDIIPFVDPDQQNLVSYWTITMRGEWFEPLMGGDNGRMHQEVKYTTAVYNQLD